MAITYAEIEKFKKVVLVYNRNSGKQFFASMMARINDVFRQLKQVLGSKTIELREIQYFDEIPQIAQEAADNKVDWVIIAGGEALSARYSSSWPTAGICLISAFFLREQSIW